MMQMRQLVEEKLGDIPDREDKAEFLLQRYLDATERSMMIYIRRFNKIGEVEGQLAKSLLAFEREELLTLFRMFTNTVVNGFAVLKSFVTDYFQWAAENGKLPRRSLMALKGISYEDIDLENVYKRSYFPTFQNLKDEWKMMLDLSETQDDSVYQSVKMMIFLSWFGVRNGEICSILKEEVSDTENSIYLKQRQKVLSLPEPMMLELREYRDAMGYYRPFHGGDLTFFPYKDSRFLLRSYRKDQLCEIDVVNALKNFSRLNDDVNGKRFQYHKIYWSGVFSRAYAYEVSNGELERGNLLLLERIFDERYQNIPSGPQKAANRLREYRRFRNYFYR